MNSVVHFEMPAQDKQRMAGFYTDVFGWQTKMLGSDMDNYVLATTTETDEAGMIKKPGAINGGFYSKSDDDPFRQHPSLVIAVDNLQESIKKVVAAGGQIHGEPMDIMGVGQFVSFVDTEGNMLSMLQPKMM